MQGHTHQMQQISCNTYHKQQIKKKQQIFDASNSSLHVGVWLWKGEPKKGKTKREKGKKTTGGGEHNKRMTGRQRVLDTTDSTVTILKQLTNATRRFNFVEERPALIGGELRALNSSPPIHPLNRFKVFLINWKRFYTTAVMHATSSFLNQLL